MLITEPPTKGAQDGDNNRPEVAAQTQRHTVTTSMSPSLEPAPNREATAFHAPAIALNASTHPEAPTGGTTGSTSTRTMSAVKNAPTASNRPPSRRSQPRTVCGARPNSAAIER